jgi:leucyl/phenylalanyl-tRNA---protein transferase
VDCCAITRELVLLPGLKLPWTQMSRREIDITPDLMLRAYRAGLFPMAEARGSSRLYWLDPEMRGVLPLDGFHLPRRLARTVLGNTFQVSCNTNFAATIALCAQPAPGREETWINSEIEALFTALHSMGHAHSIEVRADGALVGGLFGESMFSRVSNASKVALVHLVARLRLMGFSLLDTQFTTGHLAQFGTVDLPRAEYKSQLARAVDLPVAWNPEPPGIREEVFALRSRPEATPSSAPDPSGSR